MMHYEWNMATDYPKSHGTKVFTTFACGGGSTMGYKLAGYEVIAANDIDPQMKRVYEANHHPKYYFLAPIKDLLTIDLPDDLYGIDVLDGSPPCSVFSTTGLRDAAWGKEKVFREGQAKQILDDLFFDFLGLVERLQPKYVIAENVKGMLIGNAKGYTRLVMERFAELGYDAQLFLLNAATMGIPQRRERVFFCASKSDLSVTRLELDFKDAPVHFKAISDESDDNSDLTPLYLDYYRKAAPGETVGKFKTKKKLNYREVPCTVIATSPNFHPRIPRRLNKRETSLIGSFPQDYDYLDIDPNYLIGMSVPPVMMGRVAEQVYKQWIRPKEDHAEAAA